jgi:hypothetical protein
MIQYAADGLDSVRLVRRAGNASANPVGAWRSKTSTGKEALIDYRSDGTFKVWVPFTTEPGSYTISADTLIISVPKGKLNGKYLWLVVGDKLQLQPLGGADTPPTFTLTKYGG